MAHDDPHVLTNRYGDRVVFTRETTHHDGRAVRLYRYQQIELAGRELSTDAGYRSRPEARAYAAGLLMGARCVLGALVEDPDDVIYWAVTDHQQQAQRAAADAPEAPRLVLVVDNEDPR